MNPPAGLINAGILLGIGVGVKVWVLVGKLVSVFNAGTSDKVGEGIVGCKLFVGVDMGVLVAHPARNTDKTNETVI